MRTARPNGRHRFPFLAGTSRAEVPAEERIHERWRAALEDWIGQHPVTSIAVAALAGVTLGWLVKRR